MHTIVESGRQVSDHIYHIDLNQYGVGLVASAFLYWDGTTAFLLDVGRSDDVNHVLSEIEKMGIQESDRIIAVSEHTKEELIEKYQADRNKISVIYNGIDMYRFKGLDQKLGKNIILFLGRLTNQKGPTFFLRTAAKVLEKELHNMIESFRSRVFKVIGRLPSKTKSPWISSSIIGML